MKRAYLLVYNPLQFSRSVIKDWANGSYLISMWRYDLPHCIYLVSEASAAELAADFEAIVGALGRYLITEIADNRQGRLTAESWYLFRHKKRKPQK